jgi:EmrB/QacA subfamily drug resistance transporter
MRGAKVTRFTSRELFFRLQRRDPDDESVAPGADDASRPEARPVDPEPWATEVPKLAPPPADLVSEVSTLERPIDEMSEQAEARPKLWRAVLGLKSRASSAPSGQRLALRSSPPDGDDSGRRSEYPAGLTPPSGVSPVHAEFDDEGALDSASDEESGRVPTRRKGGGKIKLRRSGRMLWYGDRRSQRNLEGANAIEAPTPDTPPVEGNPRNAPTQPRLKARADTPEPPPPDSSRYAPTLPRMKTWPDASESSTPASSRRGATSTPAPESSRRASVLPPAHDSSRRVPTVPPATRGSMLPPAPRASMLPPAPESSRRGAMLPPAPESSRRGSMLPPAPRGSVLPPAPRGSVLPAEPYAAPRTSALPSEPDLSRRVPTVPPARDLSRSAPTLPPMPPAREPSRSAPTLPPVRDPSRSAPTLPPMRDPSRSAPTLPRMPAAPVVPAATGAPTLPGMRAASILPPQPGTRAASIVPSPPGTRAASIVPSPPGTRAASIVPSPPGTRAASIVPTQPRLKATSTPPPRLKTTSTPPPRLKGESARLKAALDAPTQPRLKAPAGGRTRLRLRALIGRASRKAFEAAREVEDEAGLADDGVAARAGGDGVAARAGVGEAAARVGGDDVAAREGVDDDEDVAREGVDGDDVAAREGVDDRDGVAAHAGVQGVAARSVDADDDADDDVRGRAGVDDVADAAARDVDPAVAGADGVAARAGADGVAARAGVGDVAARAANEGATRKEGAAAALAEAAEAPLDEASPEAARFARGVLAVCCLAVFAASLSITTLYVAFEDISRTFAGSSVADLSWVLNANAIVFSALIVPAGRVADRLGHKRSFLLGLTLFSFASLLCGFAPSVEMLVGARALQAAGSALLMPSSLALVLHANAPGRRASAIGVWNAVGALAGVLGPGLALVFVNHYGWRSVFFANVPLGVLALMVGRRALAESPRDEDSPLPDPFGAGLLVVALSALALGVVKGAEWGWTGWRTFVALLVGVAAAAAFVVQSRRARTPVLDLALFADRSCSVANFATFVFTAGFTVVLFGSMPFLTKVWGYSLKDAGRAFMLGPLSVVPMAVVAGRLADKHGYRPVLITGGLVAAAGGAWLAHVTSQPPDFFGLWLPGMVLTGAGVGLVLPAVGGASTATLPARSFAVGGAVNQAVRQFGTVLGVALLFALRSAAGVGHESDAFGKAYGAFALSGLVALLCGLALRAARGGRSVAAPPTEGEGAAT